MEKRPYERHYVFNLTVTDTDGEATTFNASGPEVTWQDITKNLVPALQAMGYGYMTEQRIMDEGLGVSL